MAYRILVPLDGSSVAEQVIPWADDLAAALDANVDLVRVVERDLSSEALASEVRFNQRLRSGATTESEAPDVSVLRAEALEQEARLALSRSRSKFQRARRVDLSVLGGFAPEAIVSHAHRTDATLVAMASHGRTGLARTLLGSVAAGVVRDSGVPVLVVRRDLSMPPHLPDRVLIPLDMSDLAEAALRAVMPLARELGWKLVLFSAAELPAQTLPIQGAAVPLGLPPAHTPVELMDYLEQLASDLNGEGIDAEVEVGTGEPADAIVQAADRSQTGFIAMSTHGRNGIGRWLLGSVAEAVIHRANVPVLVVRPVQMPPSPSATLPLLLTAASDGGPPVALTLTGRQARVTRLALEHLAWSATRHEDALGDIRGALAALDAASESEEGHG